MILKNLRLWLLPKTPAEGTETLYLHPPKRLSRLTRGTNGGNTGQQHLQRGPTWTKGDQPPSNTSNAPLFSSYLTLFVAVEVMDLEDQLLARAERRTSVLTSTNFHPIISTHIIETFQAPDYKNFVKIWREKTSTDGVQAKYVLTYVRKGAKLAAYMHGIKLKEKTILSF